MRSYMKVWITRDNLGNINGVVPEGFGEGPFALVRYHKVDALGNIAIFLNPGIQGVKQWRLYSDQQDGLGPRDTGLIVAPQTFAFAAAYNLQPYASHPLD